MLALQYEKANQTHMQPFGRLLQIMSFVAFQSGARLALCSYCGVGLRAKREHWWTQHVTELLKPLIHPHYRHRVAGSAVAFSRNATWSFVRSDTRP